MSNSSSFSSFYMCHNKGVRLYVSLASIMIKTSLLLPLSVLVLLMGYQQWRQQRSFAATSPSDIFTYHMAAMELISALGNLIYVCGSFVGPPEVMSAGYRMSSLVFLGQTSFQILTCVERYLAVVHPVTYLGLKQSGGMKIRNISAACVWLLCIGWTALTVLETPFSPFAQVLSMLVVSLIAVSFCSLRVLLVLIRPRPGEGGGDRGVDQSKQRAFYTVMAIMGVVCFGIVGVMVCFVAQELQVLSDGCLIMIFGYWISLPSDLVLPLLFLHRTGKLLCCH